MNLLCLQVDDIEMFIVQQGNVVRYVVSEDLGNVITDLIHSADV